ncbi:hypothetical protein ACFLRI_01210 [Bacteroidota bacterium]
MQKKSFLLSLFLICSMSLLSQTIENVQAEQIGELIKIHYQIVNATKDQTFQVKIVCSINGNLNTEIKSVFGDVGEVRGGKKEYLIIWDVFKDVEELQSADFTIRALLISNKSVTPDISQDAISPAVSQHTEPIPAPAKDRKKILFGVNIEFPPFPTGGREGIGYGICIGTLGKVGFILCPSYYTWRMEYPENGQLADFVGYATTAGLSFSVYKNHFYPYAAFGIGMNNYSYGGSSEKESLSGLAFRWGVNVIPGNTSKSTNLIVGIGATKAIEFFGMTCMLGLAF